MSFLSLPGMMKKGHFKSSLRHSWIEWSRNGCIIFENVFVFLPLTTHFYGKIVQKIQHSMRVSTFHRSIYAPNGTFSQPESTTGVRRDCDARNCFDARTISDARGPNDARTQHHHHHQKHHHHHLIIIISWRCWSHSFWWSSASSHHHHHNHHLIINMIIIILSSTWSS